MTESTWIPGAPTVLLHPFHIQFHPKSGLVGHPHGAVFDAQGFGEDMSSRQSMPVTSSMGAAFGIDAMRCAAARMT